MFNILFPTDMIDTEEYLTIRNDASNNEALYGFVPKVGGIGRVYQVHFCHYHHADTSEYTSK